MTRYRSNVLRVARRAARAAGYDLVRRPAGPLERTRAAGVAPRTVVDVGAALGDWSRACAAVFPEARYVLVEPLAEFEPALQALGRSIARVEIVWAAAGARPGTQTFNVHDDLVGSSLLREREGPHVDGVPRDVQVTTCDDLVRELGLEPPFLLKIDAQGAEADVLAGAAKTLRSSVGALVEVSFLGFFHGGASFDELVATMSAAGYVVYDISGLSYRPLDGALGQADVFFVPRDSPLRREHGYASREQRRAQSAAFAAAIRRRLERARRA